MEEVIVSVITSLFSSELFEKIKSLLGESKLQSFKDHLIEWTRDYINDHDGTVLTTGDFERFLKHYKLLDNIFDQVVSGTNSITKEDFIEKQISLFHSIQSHPEKNNFETDTLLRDFISCFYDEINRFFFDNLSETEKYMLSISHQDNCKLSGKLSRIEESLDSRMGELKKFITESIEISSEMVYPIYKSLESLILNGDIEEAKNMLQLIKGRNTDLETGVSYLLSIFSDASSVNVNFDKVQDEITDERIYVDLTSLSILLNLWNKNTEFLRSISNRNKEIARIAKDVIEDNYDEFFSVEVTKRNGLNYYEFKMENKFPNHDYLIRRICLMKLCDEHISNKVYTFDKIIGSPTNILDELIYIEYKVFENIRKLNVDYNQTEILNNDCKTLMAKAEGLCIDLKAKIYELFLEINLLNSDVDYNDILYKTPPEVRTQKNVELLLLRIKQNNKSASLSEIMRACMKYDEYWLFNNYIVDNMKDNPNCAKALIEQYKFTIEKDPSIFIIYAQLVAKYEGTDKALKLFIEYESLYKNLVEYWLVKLSVKFSESDLNHLISESKQRNLSYMHINTYEDLYVLLENYNRFDDLIELININETFGIKSLKITKIKGKALIYTKHEIEALKLFQDLYEHKQIDEEIIYYILYLAYITHRKVSESIISDAKESENPQILSILAEVLLKQKMINDAYKYNLKAMLRVNDPSSVVFNQFLRLNINGRLNKDIKSNIVDVDTVVSLHSMDGDFEKVYVIHSLDILPDEPFEWGHATHIYKETAITLGIFRKKIGDKIELDSKYYILEKVDHINSYISGICFEKLIETEQAKQISIPYDKDGNIDILEFKKLMKSVLGKSSGEPKWLEVYKNPEELPVTFYYGSKFVRVNYYELIKAILMDKTIAYRECEFIPVKNNNKYVLSFSALVVLFHLGWMENNNSEVIIPSVMKNVVYGEVESIISKNSQEDLSYMGMQNDQIYMYESTEEEKIDSMRDAVEFRKYVDNFKDKRNENDLCINKESPINLKEILGMSDYEAICLCACMKRTLVTAEMTVSAISHMPEIGVETICIANFLASEANGYSDLLKYTRKLFEYRFTIPFTSLTLKRLHYYYENGDTKTQNDISKQWLEILEIPMGEDNYKKIIIAAIQNCNDYFNSSELQYTFIESSVLTYCVLYKGGKISITRQDNGEIVPDVSY